MSPAHRSRDGFKPALFKKWRLSRSLGQLEIARRLRYAPSSISQIESGKQRPTRRFLELLQETFKVDPAQFYGLAQVAALLAAISLCSECGTWLLLCPH
jgi:transcriptional regulator with XRE-family HTH domain